jgi:hypothetical protein
MRVTIFLHVKQALRNQIEHRDACDQLRRTGFTEREISQLERFRRRSAAEQDELNRLAAARRLQFARWLVTTGRLTEQIVEVQEGEQPNEAHTGSYQPVQEVSISKPETCTVRKTGAIGTTTRSGGGRVN